MELTIQKTTVIREGTVSTDVARYQFNYTIVGEELVSVRADVFDMRDVAVQTADGDSTESREVQIGSLLMEGGLIRNGSFPFCDKYPLYVKDFSTIINTILHPTA